MRKFRQLGLSLVLAVALLGVLAVPAFANGNPTVSITVRAAVVSITNSKATWDIGTVELNAEVYFSVDGQVNHEWSTITNTGTVNVDVEIQGADLVAGNTTFNWVLATTAASEAYSLYATNTTTYDIELKNVATHPDIAVDLAHTGSDTITWSMKFTAPSAFHAEDDGLSKSATVTLVASKHIP